MLRFILKVRRTSCDHPLYESYRTIDLDVPELEKLLKSGGYSQYGSEDCSLHAVEILQPATAPASEKEGE